MGKPQLPSLINETASDGVSSRIFENVDVLFERYANYLEPIKEVSPEISHHTLATTATLLENLRRWLGRMDETTAAINVGSFIKHGFELFSAMFPALILNDIVSVQPMTRRQGEVFFLEFLYGTTRGTITKGQKLFAFNSVGNKNTFYTAENDIQESVGTGVAGKVIFTGFFNSIPIVPGSLRITDTVETFTEPATPNGTLVGSAGGSGTINSATGQYSVTFAVAPAVSQAVSALYNLDFQKNSDLIPEVDISIRSEIVTAENRKMRARYTLDAGYDVEQAWGRSVDNELKAASASAVRMETDGDICNQLALQATSTAFPWSRTPPTGVAWADHKWAFFDQSVLPAANGIFELTQKVTGNFIVAGTNVGTLIQSLAPIFRPESNVQPGPHYIGMLGEFRVYINPYYPTNQWLMGYKGSMFLEAGYIWAPYLPLYTTRTVVLDDTIGRFGLMQSAGKKMVNSNFYSKNTIS